MKNKNNDLVFFRTVTDLLDTMYEVVPEPVLQDQRMVVALANIFEAADVLSQGQREAKCLN